jgi:hypothetical protein
VHGVDERRDVSPFGFGARQVAASDHHAYNVLTRDAWYAQRDLSRTEAKRRYISIWEAYSCMVLMSVEMYRRLASVRDKSRCAYHASLIGNTPEVHAECEKWYVRNARGRRS